MATTALSEVQEILATITSGTNCVTPTLLYNEGWLAKLVLRTAAGGVSCLPFQFEPGSLWFSEVILTSIFSKRSRDDEHGETSTHADAVVGHYTFRDLTKAGMVLDTACSQLVVCEAKMFSALTPGTKRAPNFDQAARTVGCMAEALRQSARPIQSYKSLGFYVMAPASQINAGVFTDQMAKAGIRQKLVERVAMYKGQPPERALEKWLEEWALPLVDKMDVASYSWETAIDRIATVDVGYGASLDEFYRLCVKFNSREIQGSRSASASG
jgi:hypothetical protein